MNLVTPVDDLSCYITQPLSLYVSLSTPSGPWTIKDFYVYKDKVWAFSLREDFLGEISKLPTNKDLAFVAVPFPYMLR